MIVDPDFLDHWKTRLVVDLLDGDELAPLYILRIWAHCQQRKKADAFAISTPGLRALCRCTTASADALEGALIEAGFIERDGDEVRVVDWAKRNAQLVTAWKNGAAGGRGRKASAAKSGAETEPGENPSETGTEPNGNPTETETEPGANRNGTHGEAIRSRSREDKDKDKNKGNAARPAPPLQLLLAAGVDEQTAADWIAHRKAKRATASATVIEDRQRVCAQAGVTLAAGLALEVSRGWQGLKADWIANAMTADRPAALPYQSKQSQAQAWADVTTGASNHDERRIIDITPVVPFLG